MSRARLVACLLGALIAVGSVARADKKSDRKAEAKAHYDSGVRKFKLEKYDEAAEEFTTAYELSGEPAVLYSIAQAYRLAGKYEQAARFYRNVLRELPDVQNRDEIKGRIDEMDERAAAQRREAARREEERKAAAAQPQPPDAAPVAPKGAEPPPREVVTDDPHARVARKLKIVGYSLAGVAGAGLILGITMSALTAQASSHVQSAAQEGGQTFGSSLHTSQEHGLLFEKLQIVGYAVGGLAAAGAAVALYFALRPERAQAARRSRFFAHAPVLAPQIGPNGGGLVLVGRF